MGPADGPGEESVDLTVCSPQWLAVLCRDGEFVDGRHFVVVDVQHFDRRRRHDWLEKRVGSVSGRTWDEIGVKLDRIGHWEFEDYHG